jgi:hypothetical protein
MKKIFIASLAMAMIVSCVSNDNPADHRDNTKKNNGSTHLLKKATLLVQGDPPYVVDFKYNGDKITESYSAMDDEKIIFTYNGDYIAKTEEYLGGVLTVTREFSYSNGKLIAEKVTDKKKGTLVYTQNYQYVSDTHIKFNEYRDATYNPATGTYSNLLFAQVDAYLTNNGNVASANYTYEGTTYNITNSYDNSNHPMKGAKGYIQINMLNTSDGQISYNNLLNQTEKYSGTTNGINKLTAVHTIGSDNYPTKTVQTYDISSYGTSTNTALYEYY